MSAHSHVTKVEAISNGAIATCACGWTVTIIVGDPVRGRMIVDEADAHRTARSFAVWHRLTHAVIVVP